MMQEPQRLLALLLATLCLPGCTYNPFVSNNHNTGSIAGRAVGVGAGVGTAALLGAPTPIRILAGLGGGSIGYYATTQRYDATAIYYSGGQVYQLGQKVGIDVPTDKLFQANTAEFLPQATPVLDSIVTLLKRTPNNNIMISGNTSGFNSPRWERKLSQDRAKAIAAYLWNAGINQFEENSTSMRKLNYVGYGNYFPIASTLTNQGIRQNSRIQITSYPSQEDLKIDKHSLAADNIAAYKDNPPERTPSEACDHTNLADCSA